MADPKVIGIAGGGFMGSGIAEAAARSGLEVVVYEPWKEALAGATARISESVDRAVMAEKLSPADAEALHGRLTYTADLGAMSEVDVAIEAVVEQLEIKEKVFTELDGMLPEHAVLASNTSSIPITQLASVTKRRDRVLGLHFFSPVPVMKLVEIVVGLDTSDETLATAEALAERLGKTPIRTKDRSGFIVNMLLVPYLMAAVRMYEEDFASREDIDEGMRLGCGHPMGPLKLCDLIGLDVLYSVCDSLYEEFKRDEYAPPPLLKRMVTAGRLGRKSGRGFYEYAPAREPVA